MNLRNTYKPKIKASLDLLYLYGILKLAHENADSLWTTKGAGRDIFKTYNVLLSVFCFEDPDTREARKSGCEKLVAISEVFNSFIENCKINYNSCKPWISPHTYADCFELITPVAGSNRYVTSLKLLQELTYARNPK